MGSSEIVHFFPLAPYHHRMPAPRHIIDLYEQHGIDHSTALTDDELSELAKRKGCAPEEAPALSTIAVPVLPVSAEDEAIVERAVKNALVAKEPPAKKEKPARIGGKFVKKAKVDPPPSDG